MKGKSSHLQAFLMFLEISTLNEPQIWQEKPCILDDQTHHFLNSVPLCQSAPMNFKFADILENESNYRSDICMFSHIIHIWYVQNSGALLGYLLMFLPASAGQGYRGWRQAKGGWIQSFKTCGSKVKILVKNMWI